MASGTQAASATHRRLLPGWLEFPDWPIAAKLLFLVITPLLILVVSLLALTVNGLNRLAADSGDARLSEEVRVISQNFANLQHRVDVDAERLAADSVVIGGLASREGEALQRFLREESLHSELNHLEIVDAGGQRLARQQNVAVGDGQAEIFRLHQVALLGARAIRLVPSEGGWLLLAVRPVRSRTALLGAVSTGKLLDEAALLALNFERSQPLLALLDAQGRPATLSGEVADGALPVDPARVATARQGQVALDQASLADTTYRVAYAPAVTEDQVAGVFVLALSTADTERLRDQLVTTNLAVAALLGLLCVLLAWLLARHFIAAPIRQLELAARSIALGRLDVTVRSVYWQDEVGRLAGAFQQMAGRLRELIAGERQQRERLERTIERYVAYMAEVGQGHLAARVAVDGAGDPHDPLVVLGHNLNQTTASLQAMTAQVRDAVSGLSAAAVEILAATTQQAASASQQSAAVTETSTTVDEVKTISEQSTGRAREVIASAQHTLDVTRGGQQAVRQTIESVHEIRERVTEIAAHIQALSEHTQQIGEIIAAVNELASRSNLLALNAKIEAARAGEQGKGFAIVAAEVRSLAVQSRQATAQVKALLTQIQEATDAAVFATQEGTRGAEAGVQLAALSLEAIQQLGAAIDTSAQSATQMAAGGQQQAQGIGQIAAAMRSFSEATAQSLASTRQAEQAARNLTGLARSLENAVQQYEV